MWVINKKVRDAIKRLIDIKFEQKLIILRKNFSKKYKLWLGFILIWK